MGPNCEHKEFTTEKCGTLHAYIQGDINQYEAAIITCHDLGCNYNSFMDFLAHPLMEPIYKRCLWVHIVVPGQDNDEEALPANYNFPSIQDLASGVGQIVEEMKLKNVVVFGEGAGANILARFAITYSDRVFGAILIHCTGSTAGIMENIREKIVGLKLDSVGMNTGAEDFLCLHRFGSLGDKSDPDLKNMIDNFRESLRKTMNPKNLKLYIDAFNNRDNIAESIGQLKCPVLFMSGSNASHRKPVLDLYNAMKKCYREDPLMITKIDFIVVDNVANVICQRPEKVAETIQYFLQGLGLISGVQNRRMSNTIPAFRERSLSMEEYDKPKGSFDSPRRESIKE